MHRVQEQELLDDEEQKEYTGQAADEQVLQKMQKAYSS